MIARLALAWRHVEQVLPSRRREGVDVVVARQLHLGAVCVDRTSFDADVLERSVARGGLQVAVKRGVYE